MNRYLITSRSYFVSDSKPAKHQPLSISAFSTSTSMADCIIYWSSAGLQELVVGRDGHYSLTTCLARSTSDGISNMPYPDSTRVRLKITPQMTFWAWLAALCVGLSLLLLAKSWLSPT